MVWVMCVGIWEVFFPSWVLLVFSVWLVHLYLHGMHHCGIAIFKGSGPTLLWRIWGPTLGLTSPAASSGHAPWRIAATCVTSGPCRCSSTWLSFVLWRMLVGDSWLGWLKFGMAKAGWLIHVCHVRGAGFLFLLLSRSLQGNATFACPFWLFSTMWLGGNLHLGTGR
jgi:hypothetical protein